MPSKPASPGTGFHGPLYLHDDDLEVYAVIDGSIGGAAADIAPLPGGATLADVIAKVNEIIAALKTPE